MSLFVLITNPILSRKDEDYDEREYKPCTSCLNRKGWKKAGHAILFNTGLIYLPKFVICKSCNGYGYEHKTLDEQNFYDECRRE